MPSLSRREFIHHACATACACGASRAFASATPMPAAPLRSMPRSDVELTEGPMLEQFRAQQRLFLGLEDDALLKPFRQRAGLPAPGPDMGGWYDDSRDFHIDPADWASANWHGFIPGHSFGQYVSGLARGYAQTRDVATRRKVVDLVGGYAATISPRFFTDYNLPAYTYDKLAIGLIDAHRFAGVAEARAALDRLCDTVLPILPEKALTREERRARPYEREAQIWDEPYTLPENLFLATDSGMGARYRPLAMRYLQDGALFDPLAEGRSPLEGKHAYSHVNALSSAMQAYLVTGTPKYLAAARNGFSMVQAQSFATGGWGPNEELLAADDEETLYHMLSSTHRSFETPCGAYAHFKIARSLLSITGDSRYGDSMERVLYNTILGAWPTRPNGDTFYYSDYSARAHKFYRDEKWPCCSGTFAQLTADYGISTYLLGGSALFVNLYAPSRATARLGGASVALTQSTRYPFGNRSHFAIEVSRPASFGLGLRIPAWAGPRTWVTINGVKDSTPIVPGTFLSLTRKWRSGDVVDIELDRAPRLEPLNAAHPEMVALLDGPLALFPIEAPEESLARADLLAARKVSDGEWHAGSDERPLTLKPFMAIDKENYRLYSRLRSA